VKRRLFNVLTGVSLVEFIGISRPTPAKAYWIASILLILPLAIVGCSSATQPAIPPPIWPVGSVFPPEGFPEAALSPDEQRFVYTDEAASTPGFHIFVSDLGGTNRRQITDLPTVDGTPSWSPDGKKIIFTRATGLWLAPQFFGVGKMRWNGWDIWTVSLDGTLEQRLTNEKFDDAYEPHFSPDMHHIVFWADRQPPHDARFGQPGSEDIVFCDLNESGKVSTMRWMPTTPGPDGSTYFTADNREASFSPDGRTIVFISNRIGRSEPFDWELWLTDPMFSRVVQLTHLHSRASSPTFTRDGQYIHFIYWGNWNEKPAGPDGSLWQIKPDGSDLKRIR
jgi:Tol biopolymer transport system component